MDKKYKWYKIADSVNELHFASNNLLQLDVAGKTICIARGKQLYACTAKCPHAGGIIADGFLNDSDVITCPLHRYKFCLENGRNISGEGYYLKTFPIQTSETGVFIGIEEKGLMSWLK